MDGRVHLCSLCAVAAAGMLGFAAPVVACGPFFPADVLSSNDDRLLTAPAADFIRELSLLRPQTLIKVRVVLPGEKEDWRHDPFFGAATYASQTADADVADLQAYLRASPTVLAAHPDVVRRLQTFRSAIKEYATQLGDWTEVAEPDRQRPKLTRPDLALLEDLPSEFALYERGVLAWYEQKLPDARECWRQISRLPENERRYRSVWAAYMLGRSYVDSDPKRASGYFQTTRELATKGFSDTTGLAAASLGWEARGWYLQKQYGPAMELYVQQLSAGDTRAALSLRDCARAAMRLSDKDLAQLVKSPLTQQVLVAVVLSEQGNNPRYDAHPDRDGPHRLLDAIESTHAPAAGADRLAWLAYQAMDFAAADRWAKLAPGDSGLALFVRAKLAMRAGDIKSATDLLARAAAHFPANEEWALPVLAENPEDKRYRPREDALGELAILQLERSRYVESLDLLLAGNWWEDAAYVAERVLAADELKAYVDQHYPKDKRGNADQPDVRYLLARRLVRIGRWQQARDYMPSKLLPTLDSYVEGIRIGHDTAQSKAQRAAGLWQAARIARNDGMELMGCELYPDFAEFGGSYEIQDTRAARLKDKDTNTSHLNAASSDELARAQQSLPKPLTRFHYRYVAVDHAWAAAQLLPDESDQTATILNEAGSWLAPRDPTAADRFYKALVRRCGTTELGKSANQHRWFVPTPATPVSGVTQ